MELKVFLSHAWSDNESGTLKLLQNRLKASCDLWTDTRRLGSGESILPAIEEGIRNSGVFLLAWSRSAEASALVREELQIAATLQKPVAVCVIDGHTTAHSPFLDGIDCFFFSGDPAGDEAEWNRLHDKLNSGEPQQLHMPGAQRLSEQPDRITATGAELEELVYRYRQNASASNGSDAYVQSALDEFVKLFESEEDQKMRLFAEAAQAISVTYPLGKDDRRKQLLMLEAILVLDPGETEPELQELRVFLEQQHALDLAEGPVTDDTPNAPVDTNGSPRLLEAFGLVSGRQLLALQSSVSGSGDSYSSSSDTVSLQLFAGGNCHFRLVRTNYANHFGTLRDEQNEDGTWKLTEENDKLYIYFYWNNSSPERLELVVAATNEVLLNNVRYGIVDVDFVAG